MSARCMAIPELAGGRILAVRASLHCLTRCLVNAEGFRPPAHCIASLRLRMEQGGKKAQEQGQGCDAHCM